MNVQEILLALANSGKFPVAALRAADENRDAVLPVFMAEIEDYLAADAGTRPESNPLFFIFHLLGSWREKTAYRPLALLLRCPSTDVDRLLGDFSTETSHRVMAAVFDGDPQPLHDIILDAGADQFVRSRMLEALAMLTLRGELSQTSTGQFLRRCADELQPRLDCYAWEGWQSAISMLGLTELKPLVLRAFAYGSIDPFWLTVADFESDLARAGKNGATRVRGHTHEYELFGDTIAELVRCRFASGYEPNRQAAERDEHEDSGLARVADEFDYEALLRTPVVNHYRAIGRNDPCPCGSGTKFKKCCLRAPALVD